MHCYKCKLPYIKILNVLNAIVPFSWKVVNLACFKLWNDGFKWSHHTPRSNDAHRREDLCEFTDHAYKNDTVNQYVVLI